MPLNSTLMIALLLGGLVSFLSAFLVMKWRVLDHPNERSAHTVSTPNAGGLGVMVGTVLPLMFALFIGDFGPHGLAVLALVVIAILAGFLGFYDDVRDLSARTKFLALGVLAFLAAIYIYPVRLFTLDGGALAIPLIAAYLGTGLWIFVLGNAANFMDGSDGLAVGSAALAALALMFLSLDSGNMMAVFLALALLAALIGFFPLNAPPARLFLGDTGALFIGVWLAGVALIFIQDGPPSAVYAVVLVFMPWLSDVLLTMAWRAHKRMDLLRSHKDHLYQLLLRRGLSHKAVAAMLAGQTALCGVLAWVFRSSPTSALLALAAIAVFAIIGHWWARVIFAATAPNFQDSDHEV